jgi:hypothetical protein
LTGAAPGRYRGLKCIVLLAVGDIQDDLKRDVFQVAKDGDYDYLIIDAVDVARIFIAYKKLCPTHGVLLRGEVPSMPDATRRLANSWVWENPSQENTYASLDSLRVQE